MRIPADGGSGYDGGMGLAKIPRNLREKFTIEEREHAVSILKYDFPSEWKDIVDCLDSFWLKKSDITRKRKGVRTIY